ncbi:MAG: hypothetical protein M0R74_10605 [Dehalococcoidia bacterium]|nr:hypothetical protein [Dehalococcoidia bacterium]
MTTINPCPVCGKEGFHHVTGSGGENVVLDRVVGQPVRIKVKDGYPKVGGQIVTAVWREDVQIYYDEEHDVCIHLNAAIPVDGYSDAHPRQREALRKGIDIVERCLSEMMHAMNRGNFALAWDNWANIRDATRMIRK